MHIYFTEASSNPTKLAWLLSILVLIAILILIVITPIGSHVLKQRFALEGLKASLNKGDQLASEKYLQHLYAPSAFFEKTLFFFSATHDPSLSQKIHSEGIFEVISLIQSHHLRKAYALFLKRRDSWNVGYTMNLLAKNASALETHFRDTLGLVEKQFSHYQENENLLRNQERMILNLQLERKGLIEQFSLIARDFGEFFTLPPSQREPGTMELAYYKRGILRYLPQLTGLPDNITSLIDLKNKIELARGEVQVSGENQHAVFQKRLAALKNSAQETVDSYLVLLEQIAELEHNRKLQIQKLEASTIVLREKLQTLLLLYSKQKSEPLKRWL